MAMDRAIDWEAKLLSREVQVSRAEAAKSTRPATPSVREDCRADKMAWSCATHARCAGLGAETRMPSAVNAETVAGGHGSEPSM